MDKWLQLETDAPEGWFSQYDIAVLYPEVAVIPYGGLYLEVGVHLGRSLWVATQAARSDVEIWGIDVEADPKIHGSNFIKGHSNRVLWNRPIDLLFIDANHDLKHVRQDIKKYTPLVKKGGVVLFHDCDETSPGVVQAVEEWVGQTGYNLGIMKTKKLRTSIGKVVIS